MRILVAGVGNVLRGDGFGLGVARSPKGLTFTLGGNVYVHRRAHFADAALMWKRLSYLW